MKKNIIYLFSIVILLVAFSPSFAPFGLHNDYSFLELTTREWWLKYDESWWLYRIGRPLGALLMSIQMLLIKNFMSFAYWRILAVCLGFMLAVQISNQLIKHCKYNVQNGLLVATGIILLPATQVSIIWLTMITLGIIAPIIGMFAYQILPNGINISSPASLFNSFKQNYVRYIISVIILIIAMLIYPANALIGLSITAAIILCQGSIINKSFLVIRDSIIFGTSMIFYFIVIKSEMLPLSSGGVNLPEYQLKISFSLIDMLRNFLNIFEIACSSPWNVGFGISGGIIINACLFIFAGFFAYKNVPTKIYELLVIVVVILLIMFYASMPILLAPKGYYDAYRTSFVPQTIIWLGLGYLCSHHITPNKSIKICLLPCIMFASFWITIFNANLVQKNNLRELDYLSTALTQAISQKKDLLYLLKPRGTSYSVRPVRFEFALPVTHSPHLRGILSSHTQEIANAGINIGAIDENGYFTLIAGNQLKQTALICDLKQLDGTIH